MEIDFSQLTRNSESETLELKESFSNEALESIGAFANAQGGTLLIGVGNNGKVTGITIGANTLEESAEKIQAKTQPRVLTSMTVEEHDRKTVGVIKVERSDAAVSVDGRFFKRVGRTNQIMSYQEIAYRVVASSNTSWDSQIEERAEIDDLDEQLVKQFIEDLNRKGRRRVPDSHNWQEALEKLELLKDRKPTRASVLLFGKDVRRFYPSAYVKAGRFKSQIDIVDDIVFEGPLFEQLEKTTIWFKDRLSRKFIIDEPALSSSSSLQRQQEWEYPLVTLREAIANAICHRDYKADIDTTIKLFDDHLEIWNAGTLPPYLTPTDLLKPHRSYPHNKLIAQAFYNTEIIEQWGSGTMRMAEALKQQNLPAPWFDTSSPYMFKLTLYQSAPQMKLELRTE